MDYSKFDEQVDIEGLKKDVEEAKESTGEYKEVPKGTYEVSVEKMELTESKKGDPMVTIWFNILEGEYKNSKLFFNQVITKGFQIHTVNEILRAMTDGLIIDVEFDSYKQYGQLLMDIHEAIDGVYEYGIEYGENKSGYATYKITEIFQLD